ncbi:MAG: SEC-C metal-binding domain-containing protein, partial [Vicinamibacterales bacterium]
IAIDAAKFVTENSEDFILMNVESWSDEQRAEYEEANSVLQFFGTPHLTAHHETFTQFVPPAEEPRPAPPKPSVRHYGKGKVGRNELCPCGSTKKFKKCHGA